MGEHKDTGHGFSLVASADFGATGIYDVSANDAYPGIMKPEEKDRVEPVVELVETPTFAVIVGDDDAGACSVDGVCD